MAKDQFAFATSRPSVINGLILDFVLTTTLFAPSNSCLGSLDDPVYSSNALVLICCPDKGIEVLFQFFVVWEEYFRVLNHQAAEVGEALTISRFAVQSNCKAQAIFAANYLFTSEVIVQKLYQVCNCFLNEVLMHDLVAVFQY